MKKLLAILLAVTLLGSLSSTAFAASVPFQDYFSFGLENEANEKEGKESFSFGGKDYKDVTVYYFPVGDKFVLKAKANDITIDLVSNYEGTEIPATLFGDNQVGPVDDPKPLKTGQTRSFIITEANEIKVIRVKSTAKNHYWDIFYKTSAPSGATASPKTPAADSAPEQTAAPTSSGGYTHKVKAGETLASISLNYFGDMNCWPAIYSVNQKEIVAAKNRQIYAGMQLSIPAAVDHRGKTINAISPAEAGGGEKLYTVKAGDSYGSISQMRFGTPSRYKEIFERNSDRLKDIKTLIEGQVIVLP